jgi:hypothetical protein
MFPAAPQVKRAKRFLDILFDNTPEQVGARGLQ